MNVPALIVFVMLFVFVTGAPPETVTTEYKLDDINQGYDDMLAGRNIRGIIVHDH